jgi:translation initiation factor IF-3
LQRKRKGFKRAPNPKFQYKTNRQIRHQTVRLVGDNVEPGVYDIRDAQRKANELGLDLVEITSKADPPVCQIVDFNKFLYEKKKKEKELKAKQVKTVVKEIRFTPNTDDHDFDFKAKHAEKFLEEGNKVKIFVQFRGRNIVFKERGEMILLRFAQRLEEVGVPEQMPQQEGRRMFMYLAPKKTAKGKKSKSVDTSDSPNAPAPRAAQPKAEGQTAESASPEGGKAAE